ncbi:hypothetical protein [Clostridium coskatii]|nr:hypothetical protein [Clostridium coskatii]
MDNQVSHQICSKNLEISKLFNILRKENLERIVSNELSPKIAS